MFKKRRSAAIFGWDCPLLTFIYPGFDRGSGESFSKPKMVKTQDGASIIFGGSLHQFVAGTVPSEPSPTRVLIVTQLGLFDSNLNVMATIESYSKPIGIAMVGGRKLFMAGIVPFVYPGFDCGSSANSLFPDRNGFLESKL